jgi:hypothetical protein
MPRDEGAIGQGGECSFLLDSRQKFFLHFSFVTEVTLENKNVTGNSSDKNVLQSKNISSRTASTQAQFSSAFNTTRMLYMLLWWLWPLPLQQQELSTA